MNPFDDPEYQTLFEAIDQVRTHRDEFLAALQNGDMSAGDLFVRAGTDPVIGSMKVLPAVESLPSAGKVQTRRAFAELDIDEAALIGEVSADAVAQLPAALERHAR